MGRRLLTHKMRLSGDELESSAAGAGGRADVLLLAWPKHAERPSVLGLVYHTTNVLHGTASLRRDQLYCETRLLWRQFEVLPELMTLAAQAIVERLALPRPACVSDLLNTPMWSTQVFGRRADAMSAPLKLRESEETSDSETESEESL